MKILITVLVLAFSSAKAERYDDAIALLRQTPPDFETAIPLLLDEVEGGHADAQYMLGYMLETGYGVPANRDQAIAFYSQAAKAGHLEAKAALGRLGIGAFANPAHLRYLARRNAQKKEKKRRQKSKVIKGDVIQVLEGGLLIFGESCGPRLTSRQTLSKAITCNRNGDIYFIETDEAGTFADNERLNSDAVRDGVYVYQSISGSRKTVKKFIALKIRR